VSTPGASPELAGKATGGRRLIAIVYADMVGYSRLIGLDDAGTLRRLRTLRRALIDPAIREHGGRVVQTAGDSLLVVFDSIDGAVRCAVKVQQQVPVYDGDQPPDRRIRFRVGINIGDVIAHGTDLHGDGVNIAARLEAECPVGGICVSRAVRDHVHGRLDLVFEPIGELTLKNIARPVEAFVLRLDSAAENSAPRVAADAVQPATRVPSRAALVAGVAGLLVIGTGGAGWWLYRGTAIAPKASEATSSAAINPAPTPATAQAFPPADVSLSKAPRLSIVVLPFQNLSGDPKEDYLADGITEDVTTDLSRIQGMFVIARESAYTYRGKAVDVRKVGDELGVRYVLEGSVRKLGDALRVNAQLIAAETGAHLWADRFDQQPKDLTEGQEEIVRRITQTLNVALTDVESARSKRERPTNPDAFDLILRARSLALHPMGPRENAERIALLEQALKLDHTSITAMTELARGLIYGVKNFDIGNQDTLDRAAELIAEAAAINPNDPGVLNDTAFLLRAKVRYTAAIAAYQRLLEEYPNTPAAYSQIALLLNITGRFEEAVPMVEKAIRLDPQNPSPRFYYEILSFALLMLGRDEESIVWTRRALTVTPNTVALDRAYDHTMLAVAYVQLGRLEEAHRAVADANQIWPYGTVRSWTPADPSCRVCVVQMERFQEALRLAGQRDHADEDADFGVASDDKLHQDIRGLTPMTAPGAATIRTAELDRLLVERKPIVVDPLLNTWGRSIPGAVGLKDAGAGGSYSDGIQDRLRKKMQALTRGDLSTPIVAVGWSSERFDGYNLTLRLVALGYTNAYWYRGGREAWEVNGLPETKIDVQDW
jgi:TolB-like protein/class 3 adenylate cyclase/Flp pilus assembly protein TadD